MPIVKLWSVVTELQSVATALDAQNARLDAAPAIPVAVCTAFDAHNNVGCVTDPSALEVIVTTFDAHVARAPAAAALDAAATAVCRPCPAVFDADIATLDTVTTALLANVPTRKAP